MESMLLMMNVVAMAVLVFTSLRNDRLPPGAEQTGPFRFIVNAVRKADKATKGRGDNGAGGEDEAGDQASGRGSSDAGSGRRNPATSRSASQRK